MTLDPAHTPNTSCSSGALVSFAPEPSELTSLPAAEAACTVDGGWDHSPSRQFPFWSCQSRVSQESMVSLMPDRALAGHAPPTPPSPRARAGQQDLQQRTTQQTDGRSHLLRLCLDLQLDALLVTVGAASLDGANQPTLDDGREPPWRDWLAEDLAQLIEVGREVLHSHAELPAMLGASAAHASPEEALEDLRARYRVIHALLAEMVPDRDDQGAPMSEFLEHCRHRLDDLGMSDSPAQTRPVRDRFLSRTSSPPGYFCG